MMHLDLPCGLAAMHKAGAASKLSRTGAHSSAELASMLQGPGQVAALDFDVVSQDRRAVLGHLILCLEAYASAPLPDL